METLWMAQEESHVCKTAPLQNPRSRKYQDHGSLSLSLSLLYEGWDFKQQHFSSLLNPLTPTQGLAALSLLSREQELSVHGPAQGQLFSSPRSHDLHFFTCKTGRTLPPPPPTPPTLRAMDPKARWM